MMNKVLIWCLATVVLLSVLFPVGAYFGTVAVFIAAIQARRGRQVISELSSDSPVMILIFCILLSVIYSRDIFMSMGAAVLLCLNLGLYAVLLVVLKDMELQWFYKLLNLACMIACVIGIYQYASGNLNVQKSWLDEKTFGSLARVYSTLLNPNIFAAYLAINLSFAMARFKSVREDLLLSVNMILASVCLLLTYSRGGFAAFGVAMLVLCLLKQRKRGLVMYSAAMAAAFFLLNSTGPRSRADLSTVYQDSSSLYRLEIWKAALSMFLERPIFGNGIGTTWYYLSSGSDKLYRYILHCHNIYLHIATEFGIVGLCGFAYLLWSRVWGSFKLLMDREPRQEAFVLQGFIACMAGITVHGLIDAVPFVPAFTLVFMGYFAMHSKAVSVYRTAPGTVQEQRLFNGKSVLELFWSKDTRKNKYKEKESEAC